jgi:hypothetical protein
VTGHLRAAGLAGLAFVLLGAVDEDTFLCEEAAVHVAECCSEVHGRAIHCGNSGVCDGGGEALLAPRQSRCIVRRSCEELRDGAACDEIAAYLGDFEYDEPPLSLSVCR